MIRVIGLEQPDFPFEWSVSGCRTKRKFSPTSYGDKLSAREDAQAYIDYVNNPPLYVRTNDTINYKERFVRSARCTRCGK